MKYYVIRDDNTLVGVADTYDAAKELQSNDSEVQKAIQFIKRKFLKLFLKGKAALETHTYKITVAVKQEVSENDFFKQSQST